MEIGKIISLLYECLPSLPPSPLVHLCIPSLISLPMVISNWTYGFVAVAFKKKFLLYY